MTEEPILYVNGEYVTLSKARVSPLDQGFLLGDGIFDVVSSWHGMIFKLDHHLDRFFDSMRAARLETTLTREQWRDVIIETTRLNGLEDASIRFILTRGILEVSSRIPVTYNLRRSYGRHLMFFLRIKTNSLAAYG